MTGARRTSRPHRVLRLKLLVVIALGAMLGLTPVASATQGDLYAAGTTYRAGTYPQHGIYPTPTYFGPMPDERVVDINADEGDTGAKYWLQSTASWM